MKLNERLAFVDLWNFKIKLEVNNKLVDQFA